VRNVGRLSAVLYAMNRPLSEGLRLRTIRTRSRSPGDHPWLGAFYRALTREDLTTLTVRSLRTVTSAIFCAGMERPRWNGSASSIS
jgi:hypothetical protein